MSTTHMLPRRHLLGLGLGLASASLAPRVLAADLHLAHSAAPTLASADFEAGLASHPELLPLRGWDGQDRQAQRLRIEGRWPRELQGVLYRNGPGLMSRAGQRYRHWFDGDGLVQAWRFQDGQASHLARFVRTTKFQAEQQAGRFLLPTLGTAIPPERPISGADSLNTANTSVLRLQDKLYALWEGGSAYEMDADSLATRGPKAWAPQLRGMPFSAHPKVEPDGRVWNFGSTSQALMIYQLSPQGQLLRQQLLRLPMPAMVHDFAVSQRFLVFLLAPIELEMPRLRAGASMADAMQWRPEQGSRLLVLDKASLTPRWFELPAAMVFHFGNAWDSADALVLDYVQAPDLPEFNQRVAALMAGRLQASAPSRPCLLRVPLAGGAPRLERRDEAVEFPTVDPRVVAQRHRYVYYPTRVNEPQRWGFDGVMRLDLDSGARQRFAFDEGVMLEEQLMVPRPGSTREGQGWLLGLGYDLKRQRSFASVFDAERLGEGPLARAWLPYWVPPGFHGRFYAGA